MSKETFGQYICKLRTDKEMSLRELAAKLGITAYYLSYIENGVKSNPNKRIIARMFTELNMSKSEIECFLDHHAKDNGCVSYDIVQYIMQHDEVRETIRSARDQPDVSPNWEDFINSFINE